MRFIKCLLAILFVVPFFAGAQDTCHLKKETDRFTHQTKVTTGLIPFVLAGSRFSISVDATASEIDFFIWLNNEGKCFDDASTIQVNYEGDRLKANFKNTGSMNCEGAFHFTFRNTTATPSNLQRLTDRKIASIRISGSNKTVTDLVFSAAQKQQLMRMASCVVREAKTLLIK